MDNKAFREFFLGVMPYYTGFKTTVHEVIESKEERKIVIWVSSDAGSVIGPYHNVCPSSHKFTSIPLNPSLLFSTYFLSLTRDRLSEVEQRKKVMLADVDTES